MLLRGKLLFLMFIFGIAPSESDQVAIAGFSRRAPVGTTLNRNGTKTIRYAAILVTNGTIWAPLWNHYEPNKYVWHRLQFRIQYRAGGE